VTGGQFQNFTLPDHTTALSHRESLQDMFHENDTKCLNHGSFLNLETAVEREKAV